MLGCQLVDPRTCVAEAVATLGPDLLPAFYDLRNQTVQEHLCAMADAGEAVDLITLQQRLKDHGLLEQVGGVGYLSQLYDAVPSAANLSYYLAIIKEKYLLRKAITLCTEKVGNAYDYEGDADAWMDELEADVMGLRRRVGNSKSIKELVSGTVAYMEHRFANPGKLGGISTGFPDLDYYTDGLLPGEMWAIAAPPSTGKTSFALNMVEHTAVDQKVPTGVISMEMSAEALSNRMVFTRARLSMLDVRAGRLSAEDFAKSLPAVTALSTAPIYIEAPYSCTLQEFGALARRLVQQHGVKWIVGDYIQRMTNPEEKRRGNREQELSSISKGIKVVATQLGITIVMVSAVNKEGGLRDSGSVEYDVDVNCVLCRAKDEDTEEDAVMDGGSAWPMVLDVKKVRNGPTGPVNLTFLRNYTRFESAAKVADEDVPHNNERRDYGDDS